MKNLHLDNSYKIWNTYEMKIKIIQKCFKLYGSEAADIVLNRTYAGMYVEWWIHNIGYLLTLPFTKIRFMKSLNERFKHVDLEEHKK